MKTRTMSRLVLFIGALCFSLGAASGARATLLLYTFSPDASETINTKVISISGSFEFDTAAGAVTVFDITLTNGGTSEVLNESSGCCNIATFISAQSSVTGDSMGITLTQSLALDAPDLLIPGGGGCSCNFFGVNSGASDAAGSVIPAPEPPTVAILTAALGLFGLIRWRWRSA